MHKIFISINVFIELKTNTNIIFLSLLKLSSQ